MSLMPCFGKPHIRQSRHALAVLISAVAGQRRVDGAFVLPI